MTKNTILVVEDEEAIRQMLHFNLTRAGFDVLSAPTSEAALAHLAQTTPSLILVDWMLPDISGLELTRSIKSNSEQRTIPIIMLTARSQEQDKIAGLDGGADDYVTKPFSPRELVSRINALLRRTTPRVEDESVFTIGPISVNSTSHRVTAHGKKIKLGPTEFRLLEHLIKHPDRVYSRSQLLDRVWGNDVYIEERTVDVHVRRLRKALTESGCDNMIQTVRGAGYRLSNEQE
ncbi:MAG: phosphate regulon transcriptional regulator PhoB [Gammaproteobacteria bacterium]